MKILWFNHRDLKHPLAGGAERTIYEVSKRLVSSGYEVNLVSVNPGELEESEVLDGINVFRIKGNIMTHLAVPKIIGKVKPDIVIDDLAHVVPWFSPLFTSTPVIVFFRHFHGRSLSGQVNPLLAIILKVIEKNYRFIYRNNIFVTESKTSIDDLETLEIEQGRIFKILPGVDRKKFKPDKKTEKPSIIYFGGMRDYKRPWLLAEVMKAIDDPSITMNVVGSGPSLIRVKEMVNKYKLGTRINFLGRLTEDKLAIILSSSWANVHFSLTEGFGYSILESASCGVPTVALDSKGVTEVINEFNLGTTCDEIDSFQESLKKVLENNDSWSKKVYENSSIFSWENTSEQWCKLINILLEDGRIRESSRTN